MSERYGASRGCSSCPFRGDPCHEARQRVQDPEIETGRHYECQFYRGIEAARRPPSIRRFILAGE